MSSTKPQPDAATADLCNAVTRTEEALARMQDAELAFTRARLDHAEAQGKLARLVRDYVRREGADPETHRVEVNPVTGAVRVVEVEA
jgi:hypothetical protein